ncbi:MAG: hypothetical protein LBE85_13135 [Candidatus Accumulibacter sp.]|jgi:hypothetical protein|nr:hypothetical protein [Accumulibacter sp.]
MAHDPKYDILFEPIKTADDLFRGRHGEPGFQTPAQVIDGWHRARWIHRTRRSHAGRNLSRSQDGPLPRGYPSGATWENVEGVTQLKEKHIVIASTIQRKDGAVEATSASRVGALLRHEHGHALDRVIRANDFPAFVATYAEDTKELSAWLNKKLHPDAADEIRYLLQEGADGRREAFAELFAELCGGGTASSIDVARAMPRGREVVRAIMDDLNRENAP